VSSKHVQSSNTKEAATTSDEKSKGIFKKVNKSDDKKTPDKPENFVKTPPQSNQRQKRVKISPSDSNESSNPSSLNNTLKDVKFPQNLLTGK